MRKQLISEAQRMQKLAGMTISEMALPEMARTAGTGGAYTITEKGEEILKQAKATGSVPEGIKARQLEILVFLKNGINLKLLRPLKQLKDLLLSGLRNVEPCLNDVKKGPLERAQHIVNSDILNCLS